MSHELIGTAIHGYRVERKLGEGGMGQVWVARHEHLPDLVRVVKTLLPEYARVDQIRDRFFDEARIVSRFDHPNVIKVENFGTLPTGELFLIMPLLQGRPLDEVLRTAGKLGPHHTLQIAAQIGSALHYAHARGIVHRDLKPGNVFLERKGNVDVVKLLDFGIAKDASTSGANKKTRAGLAMGTPSYMACEQYEDASAVTAAADVFALAIVIWEMLTGQLPWGLLPEAILYDKQKREQPLPTPDIPRAWVPVLVAALQPEPRKRATARNLIIALGNELPALPPVWKSGAQIVKDVATDLISDATPDDETVRAKGNALLSAIPIYPSVASDPSSPFPASNPASGPVPAYAAPSMPPTANERRGGAVPAAPPPTTLSASSGVSVASPITLGKPRSGMLIALGIGGAALAGALTFGIARLRGGGNDEHGSASPTMTTTSTDAGVTATLPLDAQLEGTTAPVDAAITAAVPIDAAVTATTAASDAGIDTSMTKIKQRPVGGTNSSNTSSSKKQSTSSSPTSKGSSSTRVFDPNAPAGED